MCLVANDNKTKQFRFVPFIFCLLSETNEGDHKFFQLLKIQKNPCDWSYVTNKNLQFPFHIHIFVSTHCFLLIYLFFFFYNIFYFLKFLLSGPFRTGTVLVPVLGTECVLMWGEEENDYYIMQLWCQETPAVDKKVTCSFYKELRNHIGKGRTTHFNILFYCVEGNILPIYFLLVILIVIRYH